jgi:hypothetical protein
MYERELEQLFNTKVFDDKYKFYNASNYYNFNLELSNDTWNYIDYVSVDKDDKIRGFLSAKIDRCNEYVSSLRVINFYDMNYTFSKDFHQFLNELFTKHNFRKVVFGVVVGNPAEKMYDKYISKYGGRIVGTYKEDIRLYDGKYYDYKVYEIFKNEYEMVVR